MLWSAIFDQYLVISQKWCKIGTYCYYRRLIETHMRCIEWCYFQWPWVTPNITGNRWWPWRSLLLFVTFLSHTPREIKHMLLRACYTWIEKRTCMAGNFNYLFENEGLLKVTASHVHCICGNISETVPDGVSSVIVGILPHHSTVTRAVTWSVRPRPLSGDWSTLGY